MNPAGRRYDGDEGAPEVVLPEGDVTTGVVRVGDTVRRPRQPQSLAVAGYLDHLRQAGFDAAPAYLGQDALGRDVLEFLPGDVAASPPQAWAANPALLASVGVLLRRLHAASAGYLAATGFAAPAGSVWARDLVPVPLPLPVPPPELISHNDVTPQNVVVRDGRAIGLVDFDLAGPTTRLDDACNTAMHWIPLRPEADLWPTWRPLGLDLPARLRLFADAYGLTVAQRRGAVDVLITRAVNSRVRMQAAAQVLGGGWARMWDEGVGDAISRRRDWLEGNRAVLLGALTA